MRIFSKSRILASVLVVLFCLPFMSFVTFAGDATPTDDSGTPTSTLLPSTEKLTEADCEFIMRYVNSHTTDSTEVIDGKKIVTLSIKKDISERNKQIGITNDQQLIFVSYTQVLGCAVTTGDIKMWMVPFFIRYVLEFIIGIAGLLAVGGVVYGGYLYLFAGLSDDKDKGKNAIKNGILGFIIVLTSWAIVNIVISLVTL